MNTKYQGLQRARAYGMSRTFARISETMFEKNCAICNILLFLNKVHESSASTFAIRMISDRIIGKRSETKIY